MVKSLDNSSVKSWTQQDRIQVRISKSIPLQGNVSINNMITDYITKYEFSLLSLLLQLILQILLIQKPVQLLLLYHKWVM